jgi:hypothetical protein
LPFKRNFCAPMVFLSEDMVSCGLILLYFNAVYQGRTGLSSQVIMGSLMSVVVDFNSVLNQ